jgi:hypothetical protein
LVLVFVFGGAGFPGGAFKKLYPKRFFIDTAAGIF